MFKISDSTLVEIIIFFSVVMTILPLIKDIINRDKNRLTWTGYLFMFAAIISFYAGHEKFNRDDLFQKYLLSNIDSLKGAAYHKNENPVLDVFVENVKLNPSLVKNGDGHDITFSVSSINNYLAENAQCKFNIIQKYDGKYIVLIPNKEWEGLNKSETLHNNVYFEYHNHIRRLNTITDTGFVIFELKWDNEVGVHQPHKLKIYRLSKEYAGSGLAEASASEYDRIFEIYRSQSY